MTHTFSLNVEAPANRRVKRDRTQRTSEATSHQHEAEKTKCPIKKSPAAECRPLQKSEDTGEASDCGRLLLSVYRRQRLLLLKGKGER